MWPSYLFNTLLLRHSSALVCSMAGACEPALHGGLNAEQTGLTSPTAGRDLQARERPSMGFNAFLTRGGSLV
jgi:hypothetical protein